jgi:anthranilate/para-aminobenzoate synthase component I
VVLDDEAGIRIATPSGVRPWTGTSMDALRALLESLPPGRWPHEGAVAGALAYDAARPHAAHAPLPRLIALAVPRLAVEEAGVMVAESGPEEAADWADALLALPPRGSPGPPGVAAGPLTSPLRLEGFSSISRHDYLRSVRRLKEHIAAGDIYQANLSQRFRLPWREGGLALYDALRVKSPAPFAGYLRLGGLEIASASPERLLAVTDGRAATRPIAGTRPRSADARRDRALAAELILSEKERAEHLMLVDLARNDLGRVAEVGTVEVDEMMTVEEYSHVRHIVSNVTARLAALFDPLHALDALFPGGTITGVPKIRSMQILDAIEPVPRGFYTGALFYVTPSGRLDANILIRSAVVTEGEVTFHAGGGIVADSDPAREYEETLHKAEGLRVALEAVLQATSG